jgi:hypothetical protein
MRQPAPTPPKTAVAKPQAMTFAEAVEERDGHAYPKGCSISVKHLAFLYAYCRKHPFDIVAMYPAALSHAQLHLALAHYYAHRERYDAAIAEDFRLNGKDVLAGDTTRLPHLGLKALVDWAQEPEPVPVKRGGLNPDAFPRPSSTPPAPAGRPGKIPGRHRPTSPS